MIRPVALAALAWPCGAFSGGCSDDGVQPQQTGTTGGADGGGTSGISTTLTAGGMTMSGPNEDDGDGTGLDTSGSPPPTTGTTEAPTDSSGGPSDGTATGSGSESDSGSGSGPGSGSDSSSGSDTGSGTEGSTGGDALCDVSPTPGMLPIGSPCNGLDSACESGVCYDFADYDPFCGGTACSVCCATDDDCVAAMQAAGAPQPGNSFCLADGRCDMVGTGLGGPYFCAGG